MVLTDDQALADLVARIIERPWKLVCLSTDRNKVHKRLAEPNVRIVIFDDQAVEENERSWMLAQIRKRFSGSSLLYVADKQSDGNEKRARTNGAHYYVSRPLSPERFGYVLRSFMQVLAKPRELMALKRPGGDPL